MKEFSICVGDHNLAVDLYHSLSVLLILKVIVKSHLKVH